MKKFLLLVLTMMLGLTLCSCDNNEPAIYGTEGAKYLLAQERLNESKLKGSSSIFDGIEKLTNLATKVQRNRNNDRILSDSKDVTIDGDVYYWDADQSDYSNSIEYFNNLSTNIIHSATKGAEAIRYIKSNIRVIDVWVQSVEISHLLKVDKDSETIIEVTKDYIYICTRYQNDLGQDVYEIYEKQSGSQYRMKYIEDALLEYYCHVDDNNFTHHFTADKSKGYWDTFGSLGDCYSATVIKDSLIYDYIGECGVTDVPILDVVSSDRKNDVITIAGNQIAMYTTAFNGVDAFKLECAPEDVSTIESGGKISLIDGSYNVINYADVGIILDNGIELYPGQITDKVEYIQTYINYRFDAECYSNYCYFNVEGETLEERLLNFKEFLEEYNIVCKYDFDDIIADLLDAQNEIASNAKYKVWNGYVINTIENLHLAEEKEKEKFADFYNLYAESQNLDKIRFDNQKAYYDKISFAKIADNDSISAVYEDREITVTDLEFTVTDTRLLDINEKYIVSLGLIRNDEDNTLIILDSAEIVENPYSKNETYTIKYSGTYEIGALDEGEYMVVYYLSTSDGIRISEYKPLKFSEVSTGSFQNGKFVINTFVTEDAYLYIKCEYALDVEESLNSTSISYDELLEYLGVLATNYGYLPEDSVIEVYDGDTDSYVEFDITSEVIDGKYRIKYMAMNPEMNYVSAYAYLQVTIIPVK